MATIQDRIQRTKEEAASRPAFKSDPGEVPADGTVVVGEWRPAAGSTAHMELGSRRSVNGSSRTSRPARTRRHRITVDLDDEEYDSLIAMRSADVGISGLVRGALKLLSQRPELCDEVRRVGID